MHRTLKVGALPSGCSPTENWDKADVPGLFAVSEAAYLPMRGDSAFQFVDEIALFTVIVGR